MTIAFIFVILNNDGMFPIEFCRIFRICGILFLVIFIFKNYKNTILQILQNLYNLQNTILSNFHFQ